METVHLSRNHEEMEAGVAACGTMMGSGRCYPMHTAAFDREEMLCERCRRLQASILGFSPPPASVPPVTTNAAPITAHAGSKYLRRITSAVNPALSVEVDVYAVLEAFSVTCPGRQQAIKKLLCAGIRGKGSQVQDLEETFAALSRAVELQRTREDDHVDAK